MKSMIAENGVTFKELEKNIYKWICELGQNFTKEFLERYDQMLMKERDKTRYRHKGLRKTTIKTVYGEVTYSRAVYEVIEEDGTKHFDVWRYVKELKDTINYTGASFKLVTVGEFLGIENPEAHRALADAITTAKIFLKLKEMSGGASAPTSGDSVLDLEDW